MNFKILTNSFASAQENMAFDEQLTQSKNAAIRLYLWPQASITQAYNKAIPTQVKHIDHSTRITGGGLVFHQKNDILISLYTPVMRKQKPIQYALAHFKKNIKKILNAHTTLTDAPTNTKQKQTNIQLCQTYHSPFELYQKQQKFLAVAARKYQDMLFIHGIIHCGQPAAIFQNLQTNHPAVPNAAKPETVLQALQLHAKQLLSL